MLSACLCLLILWSMFIGTLPVPLLILVCGAGSVLTFLMRHQHESLLSIDRYARRARLQTANPCLKLLSCVLLLFLCAFSPAAWPPLSLCLLLGLLTLHSTKLSLRQYLSLLSLPLTFLLLSELALLWNYAPTASGLISLPCFDGFLVLDPAAQSFARLIAARALGALSCLYLLSLSTPLPDLLSALQKLRIPALIIDLSTLIYRYIFLLLDVHSTMKNAAASRLGYQGFKRSLRTSGTVYGMLLVKSFRRTSTCFDAMESRCYDGSIRFLTEPKPLTPKALLLFVSLLLYASVSVFSTFFRL